MFGAWLLPTGVPGGIVLRGVVLGALAGLLAMGLVFIYRANAVVNFAQGEIGAFAATLSYELMVQARWPWIAAVPVSLLASVALSTGVEFGIMRRFAQASRLIVTVVTIGVAQIVLFLQLIVPFLFDRYGLNDGEAQLAFPTPFSGQALTFSGVTFSYNEVIVLLVVPALLVGLVLFLRRSWIGGAIRAAAQNGDRASLLGIPVARLSTIAWALAGALAALAAIMRAPVAGYFPGALGGAALLARALAAAAIGRFESLPRTFLAAVGISVVETLFVYNFAQAAPLDAIVLVILLAALLLGKARQSRASWGDTSSWQAVKEVRPVPRELRSLPEVRIAGKAVIFGALLVAATVPQLFGTTYTRLASIVCIFGIVAISLVILTGWAGQVSLGQWAIAGVGAYTAGKLATSGAAPNFLVVLLVAGLVAAAVSVVLGLPALRLQGMFYGVTTLAFAVAAGGWLFRLDALQPTGFVPRPVLAGRIPLDNEGRFYLVVLVVLVAVLVAVRNFRRSRAGRLLVAARDNPRAVSSFGVSVLLTRLMTFALAGFLSGVAGALYVFLVQTAELADFGAERSILVFGLAVIGGLGSVAGAVFGAVYVLGAQYFLPSWGTFLATGLGVILFLMVFPGGLGQLLYTWRDRFLRRVAERRELLVPSLVADRAVEGTAPPALDALKTGATP